MVVCEDVRAVVAPDTWVLDSGWWLVMVVSESVSDFVAPDMCVLDSR